MKIDMTQTIRTLEGEDMIEAGKPLTLAKVAIEALLNTLPDANGRPEQQTGEEKVKLASLAQRIHADPADVQLTLEDAALVKARIGKAYVPLVVMRAWAMLEGSKETSPE